MGCAPYKLPYKLIRVIWLTIRFLSTQPKHSIYHTVQATVQATVQVTVQVTAQATTQVGFWMFLA